MKNYVNKTEVCGSRPQWPIFLVHSCRFHQLPSVSLNHLPVILSISKQTSRLPVYIYLA